MKKQPPSFLKKLFIAMFEAFGRIIKRKIDVWKEKRDIKKEFINQVKMNIKKNNEYIKRSGHTKQKGFITDEEIEIERRKTLYSGKITPYIRKQLEKRVIEQRKVI